MKCQQPISSQLHFHNGQFTSEEDWILNLATSTIIFWILPPKKYFSLWFCHRFHNLLYRELKTAVKSTMQSTDYLRKTSQIKNSWWDLGFFSYTMSVQLHLLYFWWWHSHCQNQRLQAKEQQWHPLWKGSGTVLWVLTKQTVLSWNLQLTWTLKEKKKSVPLLLAKLQRSSTRYFKKYHCLIYWWGTEAQQV